MKYFFCALIFLSSVFISCSAGQGNEKIFSDTNTIKELTETREKELLWTRELESVRLLLDTKKNPVVQDNIALEPVVMIGAQSGKEPVYPMLDDFGSLDTSLISKEMKVFLDATCNAISKWQPSEISVDSNSVYSVVLFKYDIENQWKNNFSVSFPVIEDKLKLFSGWIYGNPFVGDDYIQIPVRFFSKYGSVDILLIFTTSVYKITGIQIQKWERK
ncbi:MAG: hypothetical protein IJL70_04725 [Treponema sp.]|nr:hypothetical protein [Treponema sp.]